MLCPTGPKMCTDDQGRGGCPNVGLRNCSCCSCSNSNDCNRTIYQFAKPDLWPNWGYNGMGEADLDMGGTMPFKTPSGAGSNSIALGANAGCTYFFPNAPMSGMGPNVPDVWALIGPGSTYTGPINHDACGNTRAGCVSLCGGSGNWGDTNIEVWRHAENK